MVRFSRLLLASCLSFGLVAQPVLAQSTAEPPAAVTLPAAEVEALMTALGVQDLLPIMREEGIRYAGELEGELFAGRGNAQWEEVVSQIYSVDRMRKILARRLASEMAGTDVTPLLAFFNSDLGREIVSLEVSARRAMLDQAVNAAGREALKALRANDPQRIERLRDFIEANDLVETNIAGALNANYAFYEGLDAGGALQGQLSEEDMLREVWAQEPELREETETWVWTYLAMAYTPLDNGEIEAYTAFSNTVEGRVLNRALFAAFDELFAALSRDMGFGASRLMMSEDI